MAQLPWLFAEPEASLGEWRNRLHFELQRLAHEAQRLQATLDAGGLIPQTANRLDLQLRASKEHRQSLLQLLAPLDLHSLQASYETHLALRTRLPRDQGLHTYYANVHRDWAWGDVENELSLNEIRRAMGAGGEDVGETLILGAGACRLAYDMHMTFGNGRTVALDFNPLLLLIARAVTQGESLQLHEFPIAPKSSDDFAVLRQLAAPAPVRDGFFLVLGDALRAPFRAGSFDTVVTPWLIDVVPEDLPILASRINRLLKTGGRWINFGSLAFEHAEQARRYSAEETITIIRQAGFESEFTSEQTIPYMCSPASRHGRQETVFTFVAAKSAEAIRQPRHNAFPDWIVTAAEPVPLTQPFRTQALSTQIHSYIMSLIDGKRSITDMAKVLEQQNLMSCNEAIPAIRNFMSRMYDDSQKKA